MVKMLISIFLLVFVSSCIDLPKDEEKVLDSSISNEEVDIVSNQFYYFPTSTTQAVYERKSFVFSYSEEHEQSEWAIRVKEGRVVVRKGKRSRYMA